MAKALFGHLPAGGQPTESSEQLRQARAQLAELRDAARELERQNQVLRERIRTEQPAGSSEEPRRGWGGGGVGTAVAIGGDAAIDDVRDPLEQVVAATADGLETLALIVDDLKASVQSGMAELKSLIGQSGELGEQSREPSEPLDVYTPVGTGHYEGEGIVRPEARRGQWHYLAIGARTLNPFASPIDVQRLRMEYDSLRGAWAYSSGGDAGLDPTLSRASDDDDRS